MKMPEQNKASKLGTSQSQRRESQPDQLSSGAPGNEVYKTQQNTNWATDASAHREGPTGLPSGQVDPNASDDKAPGGNEPHATVRANSNNNVARSDHQVKLPAPSHERSASEAPGRHVPFENQPRGSMSGSYESNDCGGPVSYQNGDAHLSGGEGSSYSSPYTSKQNDGEELTN